MRRSRIQWSIATIVAVALLIVGSTEARGDACSECGPPTLEDLQKDPNFKLEVRSIGVQDKVYLHGGECRIQLLEAPSIQKRLSWLQLRGSGAVWNCPSSTGTDTMTATSAASDSREWSLSTSGGVSATFLGVGLTAEVIATVREASHVEEITTISKVMTAKYCRMIQWGGYFEVAEYTADLLFDIERRFAWWTKNPLSGSLVHRKGEIWLSCGAQVARLDMRAPITGYFELKQIACPEKECKAIPTMELGWYPPLPPGLKEPIPPGDDKAPPEEEESAPEDGKDAPETDGPEEDPEPDEEKVPSSDELGDPPTGPLPTPQASPVGEMES